MSKEAKDGAAGAAGSSDAELFDDKNVVTSKWWKPQNPGDKVSGYLVDKKLKPNTLKDKSGKTLQAIYVLMQEDGTVVNVAGRSGNPQVISGLESCKMGQLVGVKFIESKPHSTAGYNDIKVIKAFARDMFRPEFVEQYKGGGFADPEGSGEPF